MIDYRIGILIPHQGSMKTKTALSLSYLVGHFQDYRLPHARSQTIVIHAAASSLLPMTRSQLFQTAVDDKKMTHMLCIDSDMVFPRQVVHGLMKHKVPIVGANYVTKEIPCKPVAVGFDGKRVFTDPDSTGLEKVAGTGLGCVLIERKVLEAIGMPYCEVPFSLQEWKKGNLGWSGEDFDFFNKARAKGYDCWIDHDLSKLVRHVGDFTFTHDYYGEVSREEVIAAPVKADALRRA